MSEKDKTTMVGFRVSERKKELIDDYADKHNQNRSDAIRQMVDIGYRLSGPVIDIDTLTHKATKRFMQTGVLSIVSIILALITDIIVSSVANVSTQATDVSMTMFLAIGIFSAATSILCAMILGALYITDRADKGMLRAAINNGIREYYGESA